MKKGLFDFSDFDDNTVENISEKYPDMDKSEQKAICAKIRQKINTSEEFIPADAVSGVEPAKKPVFRYIFGTAAAAVFALAVIPVAFKALNNSPEVPEIPEQSQITADYVTSPTESSSSTIITITAISTASTEKPTELPVTTAKTETVPRGTILKTTENSEKNTETNPPAPPTSAKEETKAKPEVLVTTTTPVTSPPVVSEGDIFNMLSNLSYRQETCDGIPDFVLQANDGTTYQILTGCNHVWRNGREEADLTPEILEWIKKNGAPYKVNECNATAEIDWSCGNFTDNVWSVTYSDYSELITDTDELREYLSKVYRDDKVEEYLNQYNDSYFKSNVLALNAVLQGGGARNMLEIEDFVVNNREISLTANWKKAEVMESIMSICLVKIEIPKHMYVNQPINWNIADENDDYYNIRMKEIEEYERLNICTMVRERAILNGEMENINRLTFEQAEKIISESDTPNGIYDSEYVNRIIEAFNEICECPDIIGGSGITRYEYWLGDNSGNEKIIIFVEQPAVWYESKFGREQLV